jgi:methylenetetrahydrofolate dehydrogenase (NADP+)/methenyltetrahydrofolate cyclohydrolase
MKLLDGRQVAEYLQERHARTVRGLGFIPGLAIVRMGDDVATSKYLEVKSRYGEEIGVPVTVFSETESTIMGRIKALNSQHPITGIIVQLPLTPADLTDQVLAAIDPDKDVDGLGPDSPYDAATPKAVLWLLAAYNIDLRNKLIAVVGQGRLVGNPLSDALVASGQQIERIDIDTADLDQKVLPADIVVCATGKPAVLTSAMIKPGAVVVDCGSPVSELTPDLMDRSDITRTPNPGGVGPMTVAALFDNLLIAAERNKSK